MIRREIQVQIPNGMEASPIALLIQTASKFKSNIYLEYGSVRVNAKSIMGMMSIGADYEEKITLEVDGEDEAEAIESMVNFLSRTSD